MGGASTDSTNGITFEGYTGTINVAANADGTDSVSLGGHADRVLTISASPSSPSTDQNTAVSIETDIRTSFADTYTITANAPEGWTVTIDDAGRLAVLPAPGLQAGLYAVRIIAKSTTNPDFVAQTIVNLTITPTAPGITFSVDPDDLLTVPYNGAQLPTAFRAVIRNTGPVAETYALSFTGVPAGFTAIASQARVTVPAGQTGFVGVYLMPDAGEPLPPPGTLLSFTVTAASTTGPSLILSETESFTVPVIHGVELVADPAVLHTTPGTPVTATLTIRSVGNVAEVVDLSATLPAGLSADGLGSVSLGIGETKTLTITLTPGAATPLNSSLIARIVAEFGSSGQPLSQSRNLPVRVVVPGADALLGASAAAAALGNTALAGRLDDLSVALTKLVQSPSDAVAKSQALASLDSILSQLAVDPILSTFVPDVRAGRDRIAAASTPSELQAAVVALGGTLGAFGETVTALEASNVELFLSPNSQAAQPLVPTQFELHIHNVGSATTTYELSLAGLPAGVTGQLGVTSVTLARDGRTTVVFTITPTSTTDLAPFQFTVVASPTGFPQVAKSVVGSMTARREFVSVVSVDTDPPFVDPGGVVQVTARVLNAVNRVQTARASFVVRDASNQVVFTSNPVDVTLGVLTSIATVELGTVDTTGLTLGHYTIHVALTTPSGDPIPGGSGEGGLLVGSPVTASLSLDRDVVPPGTSTVTNTLVIESQTTLVGPLGVVSQTDVPGAGGVAHHGNLVYVSGSSGIRVYDTTDPAAPQLLRTFGSSATVLEVRGDKLYALNRGGPQARFFLSIYSLAEPGNPQLLGTAKYTDNIEGIPYALSWHMVVTETHAFVSLWGFTFLLGSNDIKFQTGEVIAIDISDPTAPRYVSALRNTYGSNNDGIGQFLNVDVTGGDGPLWEIVQVDPNTLLVAGSTVAGDDTQNGSGVVHVVDISDPAHMSIVRSLQIPGMVHAVGLSVEGNRALVTGSTSGWDDRGTLDFSGNTVLAALDISNPRDPVLLSTQTLNRASRGPADQFTASLGNGLFVFSSRGGTADEPALYVVDANNPQGLVAGSTAIPAFTAHLDGRGNFVYATSSSGLIIYQVDAPDAIPVTVRVDVPKANGVTLVPDSFSLQPTEIITRSEFDTLVFELSLDSGTSSRTITWQSTLTDLEPGRSRPVTLGTTIDFVSQGTIGRLTLPAEAVAVEQILGLAPAASTVRPGETAGFDVTLTNPTGASVTFNLAVQGVPAHWVAFASRVEVPAGSTVHIPLAITADAFAAPADYGFTVTAMTDSFGGSVQGRVTLAGEPLLPDAQADAHGVVLSLTPPVASAGQGGRAVYTLRLTNTGSVPETFRVIPVGLPPGATTDVSSVDVLVPPGASAFREVTFVITLPPANDAGSYTVSFRAESLGSLANATAEGMLIVSGLGVGVSLSPGQSTPGGSFMLRVTNTGTQTETYRLSLAGLGALVATLGQTQVTLAPGADAFVPVSTTAFDLALQGAVSLTAVAEAMSDAGVRAAASTNLMIEERRAVRATANPEQINLAQVPGAGTFQVLVQNHGNVGDIFEATIVSTQGPVTAYFVGFDGQPTSKITGFASPALATGALTLQVQLNGSGDGVVQVLIRSLIDPDTTSSISLKVTHAETPVPTTLQLSVTPVAPVQGEPLVLTVTITPALVDGTLGGSVIFAVDGLSLDPVPVVNKNGVFQATTTLAGLSAGSHQITATYSGDGTYSGAGAVTTVSVQAAPDATPPGIPDATPPGIPDATPPGIPDASPLGIPDATPPGIPDATPPQFADATPPRIVRVRRFGFHARRTSLALTFDAEIDRATAENTANYRLTGRRRAIRIRWARYDPETRTVLLRPASLLSLSRSYHLMAFGDGADPIRSQSGPRLDGDGDGDAGGNYGTRINRSTLVIQAPTHPAPSKALTNGISGLSGVPRGPHSLNKPARA